MIDYLQGLLAGREDGVDIEIWNEKERQWKGERLVAVDKVGLVTRGKTQAHFTPWHQIHHFRVKDNAL